KIDDVVEQHGVPIVVDRRSLMYLDNATVDFHDEINTPGFSLSNPSAQSHRPRLLNQHPAREKHLRLRQLVLDVNKQGPRMSEANPGVLFLGALSSAARAPGLHPGGHRFETCSAHL